MYEVRSTAELLSYYSVCDYYSVEYCVLCRVFVFYLHDSLKLQAPVRHLVMHFRP